MRRQFPLEIGVEKTFRRKFFLHLLKGDLQRAYTHGLQEFAVKLILARFFIEGDMPCQNDLHAIFRFKGNPGRILSENDAGNSPLCILQGEIPMAAGMGLEIGDFPLHQKAVQYKIIFQQIFDVSVDLPHRKNFWLDHLFPPCGF